MLSLTCIYILLRGNKLWPRIEVSLSASLTVYILVRGNKLLPRIDNLYIGYAYIVYTRTCIYILLRGNKLWPRIRVSLNIYTLRGDKLSPRIEVPRCFADGSRHATSIKVGQVTSIKVTSRCFLYTQASPALYI